VVITDIIDRNEVYTVAKVHIVVFRDVAQYSLVGDYHLVGQRMASNFKGCVILCVSTTYEYCFSCQTQQYTKQLAHISPCITEFIGRTMS
jgi:hypothetical protein